MADHIYWHRQPADKPLFPDLLWSRPENRTLAGKLLIIGGNAYEFAAPAEAYAIAEKAGIGVARVLLPDALKHMVGKVLAAGDFVPSTPSGSFSQRALDGLLTHSAWADGVLLAGDLGRNSETAILLEKFMNHYQGQLTLTKDAADYAIAAPQSILLRGNITLVISLAQLQRLAMRSHYPKAFTFGMDLLRLVDALHEFTLQHPLHIIVKQFDVVLAAVNGEVSTTKLGKPLDIWRVKIAAYAAIWWLQNPAHVFQALTTAVFEATNS
jgi:hypothetical protein